MKAELQVLAAATASACDRVRLEAGDGDSVNFQRWGEQPVTIIATSPASSRGRFSTAFDRFTGMRKKTSVVWGDSVILFVLEHDV